jgi:hypothetical protein
LRSLTPLPNLYSRSSGRSVILGLHSQPSSDANCGIGRAANDDRRPPKHKKLFEVSVLLLGWGHILLLTYVLVKLLFSALN